MNGCGLPISSPAPLWRIGGYRVALALRPLEDRYVASVPALPGCFAHGATRAEALGNVATAIRRHLRGRLTA